MSIGLWPGEEIAALELLERQLEKVAEYELKEIDNPDMRLCSYFTLDEKKAIAEGVKEAGRHGFMYTEDSLREAMQDMVRDDLEARVLLKISNPRDAAGIDSWTDELSTNGGDIPPFGSSFMEKCVW